MEPILLVEDETTIKESKPEAGITDEARVELSSWDGEGREIVEQIIAHFPHLFPYFSAG